MWQREDASATLGNGGTWVPGPDFKYFRKWDMTAKKRLTCTCTHVPSEFRGRLQVRQHVQSQVPACWFVGPFRFDDSHRVLHSSSFAGTCKSNTESKKHSSIYYDCEWHGILQVPELGNFRIHVDLGWWGFVSPWKSIRIPNDFE